MAEIKQKDNNIADKFSKWLDNIPAEIISKIAKIDELKGSWVTGAQLSPQALEVLLKLKKTERIGQGRSVRYKKI